MGFNSAFKGLKVFLVLNCCVNLVMNWENMPSFELKPVPISELDKVYVSATELVSLLLYCSVCSFFLEVI
jgi:hypothetical protein